MNALVCFKIMPELDILFSSGQIVVKENRLQEQHVKQIFNCFDESALELGLSLSDHYRRKGHLFDLSAVTVDDNRADLFLKQLLAVEYDRAVRITPDPDYSINFSPETIAKLICAYIKMEADTRIVFTGSQSSVGANSQTGFFIAERMGWPCISQVCKVRPGPDNNSLIVTSDIEGMSIIQTINPPVVLVVGNSPDFAYLRVPTLKQKLLVRQKKIRKLSISQLDSETLYHSENDPVLDSLEPVTENRTCKMIDHGSDRANAEVLLDRYLNRLSTK